MTNSSKLGLGARIVIPGIGLRTIYDFTSLDHANAGSYLACLPGNELGKNERVESGNQFEVVTPAWLFLSSRKVCTPSKGAGPAKLHAKVGDYLLSNRDGVGEVIFVSADFDARDYPMHVRWWWGGNVETLTPCGAVPSLRRHKLRLLRVAHHKKSPSP